MSAFLRGTLITVGALLTVLETAYLLFRAYSRMNGDPATARELERTRFPLSVRQIHLIGIAVGLLLLLDLYLLLRKG